MQTHRHNSVSDAPRRPTPWNALDLKLFVTVAKSVAGLQWLVVFIRTSSQPVLLAALNLCSCDNFLCTRWLGISQQKCL
jgi:hypothetical protein